MTTKYLKKAVFNTDNNAISCPYKKDGRMIGSDRCINCAYFKSEGFNKKLGDYVNCTYEFESKSFLKNKGRFVTAEPKAVKEQFDPKKACKDYEVKYCVGCTKIKKAKADFDAKNK